MTSPLRKLIDALIDIEQAGEGENVNDSMKVLGIVGSSGCVYEIGSVCVQEGYVGLDTDEVTIGEKFVQLYLGN